MKAPRWGGFSARGQPAAHAPPEHGVQLLGDVVVPVFNFVLAEPEDNVRVRLPIRIGRVQVRSLVGARGVRGQHFGD